MQTQVQQFTHCTQNAISLQKFLIMKNTHSCHVILVWNDEHSWWWIVVYHHNITVNRQSTTDNLH